MGVARANGDFRPLCAQQPLLGTLLLELESATGYLSEPKIYLAPATFMAPIMNSVGSALCAAVPVLTTLFIHSLVTRAQGTRISVQGPQLIVTLQSSPLKAYTSAI